MIRLIFLGIFIMHTIFRIFFVAIFIFGNFFAYAQSVSEQNNCATTSAQKYSPIGYWQTTDDVTGKPRAIIHICAVNNETLFFGEVIQVNYAQEESADDQCMKCSPQDWRQNKPNLGLVILTDMKTDPSNPLKLQGGKILDPSLGKIYDAQMTLSHNGQSLEVRGYLLFTLLGRSQTWHRIQPDQLDTLLGTPLEDQDNHDYSKTTLGKFVANDYLSCDAMQEKIQQAIN